MCGGGGAWSDCFCVGVRREQTFFASECVESRLFLRRSAQIEGRSMREDSASVSYPAQEHSEEQEYAVSSSSQGILRLPPSMIVRIAFSHH